MRPAVDRVASRLIEAFRSWKLPGKSASGLVANVMRMAMADDAANCWHEAIRRPARLQHERHGSARAELHGRVNRQDLRSVDHGRWLGRQVLVAQFTDDTDDV